MSYTALLLELTQPKAVEAARKVKQNFMVGLFARRGATTPTPQASLVQQLKKELRNVTNFDPFATALLERYDEAGRRDAAW